MTTHLTATATRSEGWWAVSVPEVDGLFTQTRRLDQIPAMVRDALTLFPELGIDPADTEINVVPTGDLRHVADEIRALRESAEQAQSRATAAMRSGARTMKNEGLSYRDIGAILGISHQRAQQLATAGDAAPA